MITDIKNPYSEEPTLDAINYSVYTEKMFEIEKTSFAHFLRVNNTIPGDFDVNKTSIVPNDFRLNEEANYTLSFSPVNYEQNMDIVLTIPKEVEFTSQPLRCEGIAGTDYPVVDCIVDQQARTITINDAVTYQRGNPGTIKILFNKLKNPSENIITNSFSIETKTSDGFKLDNILSNVTVNFYCEYPCMSCNRDEKSHCNSCYPQSPFELWHSAECLTECPSGFVNTTSYNCTACVEPCATCINNQDTCTTCIEGYWKLADQNTCYLKVFYPFPWFCLALFFFILIVISEIVTKTESRFKESFIALVSLPEMGAWITYIVFLFVTIDYRSYTTGNAFKDDEKRIPAWLACIGLATYCLINFSHALMHPRRMVPNTSESYKKLSKTHKWGTRFHQWVSYLISFKYSLILVSFMWSRPQYAGDYTAMNWTQFNRISFSFLFISYPLMMGSTIYYLMTVGFWNYAGFAACEVIVLSTNMAVLMLLDALSSIKCRSLRKRAKLTRSRVASGADYESDEDERPSKRAQRAMQKKRAKTAGGYEDDSDMSFADKYNQTGTEKDHMGLMDEETRKQILMLEELAAQMKLEKEEIRIAKQKIEDERLQMEKERVQQEQFLDQFRRESNV